MKETEAEDDAARAVDCLIVGAGLAGLLAAGELRDAKVKTIVLDKGRGVGGRLATRRTEAGTFDHGAQFFTVRTPEFQAHVDEWLRIGVAREWCRGFAHADGVAHADGHPRFCCPGGMTRIAKHLAAGLDVRTNTRVDRIMQTDSGWEVATDAGDVWRARGLVLSAPAPQSLALAESGDFRLDAHTRAQLERITYDPCVAVMASFDGGVTLPEPGAIQIEGGEPVYWIADNTRKGVSTQASAITIHAGAAWSRANYDLDDAGIASALIEAVRVYLRDGSGAAVARPTPRESQIKRWRYSKPRATHDERCLTVGAPPLVFAGDGFGGARVEGAALSGLAAAESMRRLLAPMFQETPR